MKKNRSEKQTRKSKRQIAVGGAKTKAVKRAKKDPVPEPKDHPESGMCHFCEETCGDNDYCFGCKTFVCEKHSVNFNLPFGGHAPEAHLESGMEEESEDEDL